MSSNLVLRHATRQDVPTILAMMRATAAEQGAGSEVTATEQDLLDSIDFGDSQELTANAPRGRFAKTIVAVAPEGIAGMATYYLTFVAWAGRTGVCLEDLYVAPEYRRLGCAKELVQAVAKEAKDLGCLRVDWQAYQDNHRALRFYESLGAKAMTPRVCLRLDKEGMEELVASQDGS